MANVEQAETPSHPLHSVDPDKCYEWMLAQCAALNASREARQDGLIATITQISSAAILAIPGLVFASGAATPTLSDSPLLYAGVILFIAALLAALAEQHLSVVAFSKQVEITQSYYLKESAQTQDEKSLGRLKMARTFAYVFFVSGILLASIGLFSA